MKLLRSLLAAALLAAMLLCISCGEPSSTPPPETPDPVTGEDAFAQCETPPADLERTDASFGEWQIKTAVQNGIIEKNGIYTITKGGDYTVSGKLTEGAFRIEVDKTEKVKLILAGAYLSSEFYAPISLVSADELTVKVEEGTYNVIEDRRSTVAIGDVDAAIYSKDDLTFSGRGVLIVHSENGMGAHSSNDIHIKNISLKVQASDTAIKGNDSVTVESGTLCLISHGEDGIKTSNTDVSSKGKQRGCVDIQGGRVDIFCAGDGIQAAYTYQQAGNACVGIRTGTYGKDPYSESNTVTATSSSKGIKCEHELLIKGGTLFVLATEDALQANGGAVHENGTTGTGALSISGARVRCASAKTALQADGNLAVSNAFVIVEKLGTSLPVDASGDITYMTSTVLVLGRTNTLPEDTLTLTDLSLTANTYTLGTEGETPLVFTVHGEHTSLQLWMSDGMTPGEYTLKIGESTVHTFTVTANEVP